jgi:hypothetical protein
MMLAVGALIEIEGQCFPFTWSKVIVITHGSWTQTPTVYVYALFLVIIKDTVFN